MKIKTKNALVVYSLNNEIYEAKYPYKVSFDIKKWTETDITVVYYISHDKLGEFFIDWFNKPDNKPLNLSKYEIKYEYEYIVSGGTTGAITIDSFYFHKPSFSFYVYNNSELIEKIKISSLRFSNTDVSKRSQRDNGFTYTDFILNNNITVKSFLDAIKAEF